METKEKTTNATGLYAGAMKVGIWCTIIFAVADIVFTNLQRMNLGYGLDPISFVQNLLLIFCLIFLLIGYRRHDKNVMNLSAGAVLLMITLYHLQYTDFSLEAEESCLWWIRLGDIVSSVLLVISFINFVLMVNAHNRSFAQAYFNVVLLFILFAVGVFQIGEDVYHILRHVENITEGKEFSSIANMSAWILLRLFAVFTLVSLSLQLNEFKTEKEKREQ